MIARHNHRHRPALSEPPDGPRSPNPRPSTYPRPARDASAGRTDVCNQRRREGSARRIHIELLIAISSILTVDGIQCGPATLIYDTQAKVRLITSVL